MDEAKLNQLGDVAYSRSIHPMKLPRHTRYPFVGFDTEYTSKTAKLICFQLWSGDNGRLIEVHPGEKLTPEWLYQECCGLLHDTPSDLFLVTYFSLAELQHLPLVTDGFNIMEFANGSLDVTFRGAVGKLLHIFDLQRWWSSPNQSLAKAAKSFGMEKLEWDRKTVTRKDLRSERFRRYSLNDAKLCHDLAVKLKEKWTSETGVDPFTHKTPAGTSAAAFKHMFVKKKLFNDSNKARWLACKGTWGGHAEVFRRGVLKGTYTEWDFKSAYPTSAIKLGEMPIQGSWKTFTSLRSAKKMRGGFAHVYFKWPKSERYPCLPVNVRDAMLYPLEGESFCTLAEIRVAASMGCEIKVVDGLGYERGTKALADFLTWTLNNRATATGAGRVMYKLLGNSIIGKFAQRISKVPIDEYYRLAQDWNVYLDELFELSTEELEALGARSVVNVGAVWMPEWNGLITGYTRAALAQLVRTGEAVYCHTDSVWTKKRPSSDMLPFDVKTRGPVKIVRTRFACMGKTITPKAVKEEKSHVAHHSVWNLTAACQMLSRFQGQSFTRKYPIRRPLKLREALRTKRTPGTWVEEWRQANTCWDAKRILHRDGTTSPYPTVEAYLEAIRNL